MARPLDEELKKESKTFRSIGEEIKLTTTRWKEEILEVIGQRFDPAQFDASKQSLEKTIENAQKELCGQQGDFGILSHRDLCRVRFPSETRWIDARLWPAMVKVMTPLYNVDDLKKTGDLQAARDLCKITLEDMQKASIGLGEVVGCKHHVDHFDWESGFDGWVSKERQPELPELLRTVRVYPVERWIVRIAMASLTEPEDMRVRAYAVHRLQLINTWLHL